MLQAVQSFEAEVKEIEASRKHAMQSVKLSEPYFEAGLLGTQEAEPDGEEDAFKSDYLARFLPIGKAPGLTKLQATEARDACLQVASQFSLALHCDALGRTPPHPLPTSPSDFPLQPPPPTHLPLPLPFLRGVQRYGAYII